MKKVNQLSCTIIEMNISNSALEKTGTFSSQTNHEDCFHIDISSLVERITQSTLPDVLEFNTTPVGSEEW